MFQKILIANRGEIACRVAATARRLGIASVAVYSEVDAMARHVTWCDEAYPLGGAAARDSYLRQDAIIACALQSGAQAIHPGYGFLSENEDFATAVAQAGLVFIGPPPGAIAAMGNKAAAKALMQKAGVPLVPGYHGAEQEASLLHAQADAIGYPVLIKAASGGGGKGMRVVAARADFPAALASCQREAQAAFGDADVLIERYLERPRHIEIQVFADQHDTCLYLFERDCSVQRRHQKVLEEAPAPGMDATRRQAMGQAAVAAARAVGYVGAGTVEFIAEQDGRFFFMEMNTRLQVEHPVTEMITGFDLVEWQLRVAAGEPLPVAQEALRMHGHAIEARIYAENPERDFLPATGTLDVLRFPPALQFSLGSATAPAGEAATRVDSGVREGDVISPFYDPMIAKLIVWGPDRATALTRMSAALSRCRIVGVATNLGFLYRLVNHEDFCRGALDTGLIERGRAELLPQAAAPDTRTLALAIAAILDQEQHSMPDDPWRALGAWRLNAHAHRRFLFAREEAPETVYAVALSAREPGQWLIEEAHPQTHPQTHHQAHHQARLSYRCEGEQITLSLDGVACTGDVIRLGDQFTVSASHETTTLRLIDVREQAKSQDSEGGRLTAPMPGKVVALLVGPGSAVTRGAPLLIMEAMKMEHTIAAPSDGIVAEILYAVGDQVDDGAQLLVFQAPAKVP